MNDVSNRIAALSPSKKALLAQLLKQKRQGALDKVHPQDRSSELLEVSFAQQRLVFFDALYPEAAIYNMGGAARFRGHLDISALMRSIETILARHEVLRVSFPQVDGVPVPRIAPSLTLPIEQLDLRDLPAEERESAARISMVERCRAPYDLAKGPLLRFVIIRLADDEILGLLTMHHAISDGWSTKVLFREFVACYEALTRPNPSPPELPSLTVQYTDFAAWQRRLFDRGGMAQQLAYWHERLRDAPPLLELVTDFPRPQQQQFHGGRIAITVPPALTRGLAELARREGATLFMLLLAALEVLLYRYSGQTDIVVGTPVAGRNRPELEPLIGCFLNMLALRTEIDEEQTFQEFLQAVKDAALSSFANQDVPFEKLLEDLNIERNLGYSPIYQVAFSFEENPLAHVRMRDLALTFEEVDTQTAKVDLALELTVEGDALSGWFEYRTDLFAPERIERLRDGFLTLLASIREAPRTRLPDLNLLPPSELTTLLELGCGERRDYPLAGTIHRLFESQVDRAPQSIALVQQAATMTYSELDALSNRIAALLIHQGVSPSTLVGAMLEPSFTMIAAVLGILKAGAGYAYLDSSLPDERISLILNDAEISVVLATVQERERLEALGAATLDCMVDAAPYPARRQSRAGSVEGLAYAVFTSGSTGAPKGVSVDHRGLVNHTCAFIENHELDDQDRVLQFASLSFDAAAATVFPPLLAGATLVLPHVERADLAGETLLRLLDEQRITVLHLPVSAWHEWVDFLDERGLTVAAPIKVMLVGGDAPDARKLRQWARLTSQPTSFLNAYGPTEAVITTTLLKLRCDRETAGSVEEIALGSPLPNKRIYLLDRHLKPVPLGMPGEICVGGVGLSQGYLARPELTTETFVPDPYSAESGDRIYRTGDLACWRPDGTLRFLGRRDRQVKLRGFRIELGEIENVLRSHPDIQDATVIVHGETERAKQLAAYSIARSGNPIPDADLIAFLQDRLPNYMVPVSLQWLSAFPLTSRGKIDRTALPTPRATAAAKERYVAPETDTQRAIAAIWAETLGCDKVGLEDNFFVLGGHSLLGARVVSRMRECLGWAIPMRTLFEYPTVADLAAWVDAGDKQQAVETRPPMEEGDELPQIVPDRENAFAPFPLNDVQQAYWIGRGDSLEMGNVSCHGYEEFDSSDLDVERLNRAWNRLVERHSMLRAVIEPSGMQRILPEIPEYIFERQDLTRMTPRDREAALASTRERMSHQVHDVETWPLFEILVSHIDETRVRLHVSIDLLIADARSFQILLIELYELYRDPNRVFAPLELGFRDYVLAEEAVRQTRRYQEDREYWSRRLETLPPAPELPLARAQDTLAKPTFTRRKGRLEKARWQRLKAHAATLGITPSSLTLAVFAAVVNQWVRESRFTINLTMFNRLPLHPQVNDIFGDFTSVTLLEADFTGQRTFAEQLKVLQRQLWDDLDHSLVGGIKVQRDLMQLHGIGGARMPVVFTSTLTMKAESQEKIPMSWLGKEVYSIGQTPQVWLDHQVFEEDGDLTFNWDAVEDLFPPGMIEAMFGAYRSLLDFLSEDTRRWTRPLPAQIPQDQLQRRAEMNDTAGSIPDATLHGLFLAAAAEHPDRPAVIAGEMRLTYRELLLHAGHLARSLRECGAEPDRCIAIVMDKCWQQVVAALGILMTGGAYVPIAAGLPQERREALIARSGAVLIVTASQTESALTWHNDLPRVRVADDCPADEGDPAFAPIENPAALAYVIYTSGSTGFPKGVAIDHRGAVNTILDINERFGVGKDDRALAISALSFDLSVYDIFGLLAVGGALVLPDADDQKDPAHWENMIERHGITLWSSVPALMAMLAEHTGSRGSKALERLRLIMLSGDWIPIDLPGKIKAQNPQVALYSLGGATEASIWSIYYPINAIDPDWVSVPYGRAFKNQTMQVLDSNLQPAPVWVAGEIYIGGIGLAKEYLGDPAKTEEKFIVHPTTGERLYRTGDLGRFLPDGNMEFLGREDFQVKINGYRIELGEIETALVRHPGIQDASVAALGRQQEARRLVAYWVQTEGEEKADKEDLKRWLAEQIPEYMIPETWMELPRIPLSANGKVDRKALPDPVAPEEDRTIVAPATGLEHELCQLFSEALETEHVGSRHNFFELGGNSVMVVQLISQIRETYGVELSLRDFFMKPTIAQLAETIEVLRWAGAEPDRDGEDREEGEI